MEYSVRLPYHAGRRLHTATPFYSLLAVLLVIYLPQINHQSDACSGRVYTSSSTNLPDTRYAAIRDRAYVTQRVGTHTLAWIESGPDAPLHARAHTSSGQAYHAPCVAEPQQYRVNADMGHALPHASMLAACRALSQALSATRAGGGRKLPTAA